MRPWSAEAEACHLLRSSFAAWLQAALFVLAAGVLLAKHAVCEARETRRPWRVWLGDVSKQGLSGVLAHGLNLLLAKALAAAHSMYGDECAWYAVNFTIDTTFGIGVQWAILRARERLAARLRWRALQTTGDYSGARGGAATWALQMVAWAVNVVLTKAMLGAVQLVLAPQLGALGHALLTVPLGDRPELELTIVMLVCPLGLNVVQALVLDVILKFRKRRTKRRAGSDGSDAAAPPPTRLRALAARGCTPSSGRFGGAIEFAALSEDGGIMDDTLGSTDTRLSPRSP